MWRYRFLPLLMISFLPAQEADRIPFPHDFHVQEAEIECVICHSNASESQSVFTQSLLPTMETCGDCHDIDDDCGLCHTNMDEPLPLAESRPQYTQDFSHQNHLEKNMECSTCHAYILEDDGSTPGKLWQPVDCQNCHQQKKPEFHTLDWKQNHGLGMNLASQDRCEVCHTSDFCDQCHQYQPFEPKVHAGDYIQRHGFEARTGVTDCGTCHDVEATCYTCHRQRLIMPLDHSIPNWANRIPGEGGRHGEAALDSPEICQVCHRLDRDATCLDCHEE
ncbi:MAG: cytochrome c3 family protein [FCB group bacterium]|nr:cytochrome c3 family protein [FCB group bacterium]